MDNILIYILISIVLIFCFYFIISNYNTINNNNFKDTNTDLSKLKNELDNIKTILSENINNIKNDYSKINFIKDENISNNSSQNTYNDNLTNQTNQTESNNDTNINISNQKNNNPPIVFDPIANYDRAKLIDPLVDPRSRTSADQIPAPQIAAQFNFPTQGVLDRYHRVGLLINKNIKQKNHKYKKHDNYTYDSDNESTDSDELNNVGKFRQKKPRRYNYNPQDDNSSQKSYNGIEFAKENFGNLDDIEEFDNTTNIYNIYNSNENDILELIGKKVNNNYYRYFTSISKGNKIIKINVNNRNNKELYSGDEVFIPELNKFYRVKIDKMDMIDYNPYIL